MGKQNGNVHVTINWLTIASGMIHGSRLTARDWCSNCLWLNGK